VQEPNEVCVGDAKPPRVVNMDVGDMYGCPSLSKHVDLGKF